MKICRKCKREKSIDEFYPKNSGKGGKDARCKKCVKAKVKAYYLQNKEVARTGNNAACRKFRREKKAKNDLTQKKYRDAHKNAINARERKRWKHDDQHRLHKLISCRVRLTLKGGKSGNNWESLVGYSVQELERSLKHKIPKGFTWEDFLDGKLHIDHKTPVAVFNFQSFDDIDFKRCWALDNLQLLPAIENIKKGKRLAAPFQPSLIGVRI